MDVKVFVPLSINERIRKVVRKEDIVVTHNIVTPLRYACCKIKIHIQPFVGRGVCLLAHSGVQNLHGFEGRSWYVDDSKWVRPMESNIRSRNKSL